MKKYTEQSVKRENFQNGGKSQIFYHFIIKLLLRLEMLMMMMGDRHW